MLQSTLTTSSPSSLKNNLQPPYKLPSFFFFLSTQLQSWIWIPYIKTSSRLFLVTQLLQNTPPQMASGLQTQMVYSSSTTKFMYYLLVTSVYAFSSIIMITSLPDILVKIKHQNQSTIDTPGPVSMLMYNNSASPVSLVCDPIHNITSPMDLSNNFLSLNGYGISFLWTSSRNFHHSPGLTLSWLQSTSLPSRQSLSLLMIPSCPQTQHIYFSFMCFPNIAFLPMLPLIETRSLCQTSFDLQALLLTCGFTLLQIITLKVMDKLNTQIRLSSNTSIYIVTTSKTTGPNSYLLWSLPIIMLQVLLLVFLHSLLIRDIIQTSLFTLNMILLPPKPVTSPQISINYRVLSKLKSLQPNSIIRNLLMHGVLPLLILKQVTKSLSRLSSSKPPGLQRNFPKNISDPTKSSLSLALYCSLSIFQSLCTLSIQSSICSCLNPPYPTLSLREYSWPLLQS